MTRQTVTLYNLQQGHQAYSALWMWCKSMLAADHRLTIEARPEKRSDAQSRLMWSSLGDLSRQVDWHGQKLEASDWKEMCTAALKKQRVVPGLEGGFVVLGASTRAMTKAEMTELIDFVHMVGANHGVIWSPASIAMDAAAMETA